MTARTALRAVPQLALTAVLVGVLVWRGNVGDLLHALRQAGWRWVLVAAPIAWLSLAAHGLRWWLLMRRAGAHVPLRVSLRLLLAASGLGVVLPLRAGTALQLQVLHRRYGVRRTTVAGTLVVEGLLDAVVLTLLALAVLPVLGMGSGAARTLLILAGAGVVIAAGVVALRTRVPRRLWRALVPARFRTPLSGAVAGLGHGFAALRSGRATLVLLGLTLATWLCSAVAYGVIGHAFDLGVPLVAYLAVEIVTNLSGILPLTQANVGTFELAVTGTLVRFGAPGDAAVAFAVAAHVAGIVGIALIGLAAAWVLHLRREDVFYLSAETPVG